MKTVHKSVLIWYSAQEMFDLVTDVDRYPEFLPWCDQAKVLTVSGDDVTAEVGIAFSGIRQVFVTRNRHVAGRSVVLTLERGPFSKLDGEWTFAPVGQAQHDGPDSARACRVDLMLHYSFDNKALATLVGPVFDRIAASLVDAFVKRAEQVYR